jgi:hypothetical protein
MGLNIYSDYQYYATPSTYGNYQFVNLADIIKAFMMMYVGEGKIISKVSRNDVQFHAMRAMQELTYDVFKSIKSQEIKLPPSLKMALPHDYVNYVKLVRVGDDGVERVLYPTGKTSNPFSVKQDDDGTYRYIGQSWACRVTIPVDILGGNTSGQQINDGDYLTLPWIMYDDSGNFMSNSQVFFIFNKDSDVEDGANPLTSLVGPRFNVVYNDNSTQSDVATLLKQAILNFGKHDVELGDDGVLHISLKKIGNIPGNLLVGMASESQTSGGGGSSVSYTLVNSGGGNETLDYNVSSTTWDNYQDNTPSNNYDVSDSTDSELDYFGRRYGLDPQHAQGNGTFYIDPLKGYIHFSGSLSGETIILKYISDSLGTDAEMVVHKFCEEAMYKWIAYGVLSCRSGIPDGVLMRFKQEKFTETRKAKIRLSNIKIEEFAQIVKGMGKQIK